MLNSKFKLMKNKSLEKRWFVSYFLLLLLPIIVSVSVYIKIDRIMEKEIIQTNQLQLLQMKNELDGIFDTQKRVCIEIAYNSNVDDMLHTDDMAELMDLRKKISELLKTVSLSNEDKIDEIFVYYYDLDIVITPSSIFDSKTFYYMYYSDCDIRYEDWLNLVQNRKIDRYTVIETGVDNYDKEKQIVYFSNIPIFSSLSEPKAIVGTIFKYKKLENVASEFEKTTGGKLVIFNENKDVFFESSKGASENVGIADVDGGKGRNIYFGTESSVSGWNYMISVDTDTYWEQIFFARFLMVLYVAFSLLIGWLMSRIFVKQNIAPIDRIIKSLNAKIQSGGEYDEYSVIFEETSKILAERDSVSNELKETKKALRRNYLMRILTGQIKDWKDDERNHDFGIEFVSDIFAVAMFGVDDYENLFADEDDLSNERRKDYYQLIVANIAEEILGEEYTCYVFDMDGLMTAIVGIENEKCDNALDDICDALRRGIELIEKHFGILVSAIVSDIHKFSGSISECYYEAYDGIKIMQNTKQYGVVKYSELRNDRILKFYEHTEKEIHLCNFIRTGDSAKAKQILRELFDEHFKSGDSQIELIRCVMYNVLNAMCRVSEDRPGLYTNFSKEEYLDRLLHCKSVAAIESIMYEVCDKLATFSEDGKSRNHSLVVNVKRLVEEKYMNQGFGVMEVGEYFNLTPSYVSRIFKTETGELLAEYITGVRVNKAKKLIRETNYTIDTIAGKVGYLNSKIFSRAFKKVEGILPSHYREIVNESKSYI